MDLYVKIRLLYTIGMTKIEVKGNHMRTGPKRGGWDAVTVVLTVALLLLAIVSTLIAETISGVPVIVDGDTVKFPEMGERIRLEGVDAPESRQQCLDGAGKRYRCGQAARSALAGFIGRKPVRCEGSQRDRYGRLIAVCFDADGTDLNGWLVSQGWALAYRRYSKQYIRQEEAARKARRGMWSGRFVKPWQWRRGERME